MLAGLTVPGLSGVPLTEQFGARQRFVAIVTDLEMDEEKLPDMSRACDACDAPCLRACPTGALAASSRTMEVDDTSITIPDVDCFACDWAKRYCLSGEEGPDYCGADVDVPVPERRDPKTVAEAVSGAEWSVQKRLLCIAEECVRVCPAHRM